MIINPINAVSTPETMGMKCMLNRGSTKICAIYQISPNTYPTIIVHMKPIIDPMILIFLFLKIKYKIKDDITIGIIITNVGTVNTNNNPSSIYFPPLLLDMS